MPLHVVCRGEECQSGTSVSNKQTDTPTDIATYWAAFTDKNIVLHNKAWTELLGSCGH